MKKLLLLFALLLGTVGAWAQNVETSTEVSPVYYTISSYDRGGCLTWGGSNAVQHVPFSEASFWYFVAVEDDENDGVYIVNKQKNANNEKLYLNGNSVTTSPSVWYILNNDVNEYGFVLSTKAALDNTNCCLDASNTGSGIGWWKPSSGDWQGTTWVFRKSIYDAFELVGYSKLVDGSKVMLKAIGDRKGYAYKGFKTESDLNGAMYISNNGVPSLENFVFTVENSGTEGAFKLKAFDGTYFKGGDSFGTSEDAKTFTLKAKPNAGYGVWNVAYDNTYLNMNPSGDATLPIKSEYKGTGWNSEGDANGKWEVYYVEAEANKEITVNLTDVNGNNYTHNYTGYLGSSLPTIANCTLSSFEWTSLGELTANVTFPFPTSKVDGSTNWTYISSAGMDKNYKGYLYVNGTAIKTMSTDPANAYSYLPTNKEGEQEKWMWAIYPSLVDGEFTFQIKNASTGKYIQGTGANSKVSVGDTPATFLWNPCISSGYGFCLSGTSVFLSVNSSSAGEKDAILWTKPASSNHKGANLQFYTPDDFSQLNTNIQNAYNYFTSEDIVIGETFGTYSKDEEVYEGIKTSAQLIVEGTVNATAIEMSDLIQKMNTREGLTLYTTPYVYALKCIGDNNTAYLSLTDLENGYNGDANATKSAAVFAEVPTYFTISTENNKGYVLTVYGMDNRYLGIASWYGWNARNDAKYNWIIEPIANVEEKFYIMQDKNGTGKYLGNIDGIKNGENYRYIYTDQQESHNTKKSLQWELVPMTQSVSITDARVATLYSNKSLEIPVGITAKYLNSADNVSIENGVLTYTSLTEGVISANTGVVLIGNKGNYDFKVTTQAGEAVEDNLLFGYTDATAVAGSEHEGVGAEGTVYALANKEGLVAFYHYVGEKYVAGKAYLDVAPLNVAGVRYFTIFDEGAETAIESVEGENEKTEIYDLAGRRVQNAQKGVFVVNGKVVIK